MKQRTAIIIGGGIAGPVTALALRRAGLSPVVYEAYPESEDAGGWLTLAVNGLDALRSLDLHGPLISAGFATRKIRFLNGAGAPLGELPIGGTLADGTVTHTLRRSDLYKVLRAQCRREGLRFEHSKRLVAAETSDTGVLARFADGSEARGDLLIGADGINSRTRELLDPDAPKPRYTGLGNMGGFTPAGVLALPPGDCTMIFGKRCFFGMAAHPSGEIWWFANPHRKAPISRAELAATSSDVWREHIAALFDGDVGPAARIVRATAGPVIAANQYDMPRVPVWRRGAMVIVGDAAHAVGPSSGQGASMAIEDAVVLAGCLRDAATTEAGLAAYEARRRERVERVVAHGARMGSTKTVGPVGRVFRDLMLPTMLRYLGKHHGPESLSWLYAHHIDWDARFA